MSVDVCLYSAHYELMEGSFGCWLPVSAGSGGIIAPLISLFSQPVIHSHLQVRLKCTLIDMHTTLPVYTDMYTLNKQKRLLHDRFLLIVSSIFVIIGFQTRQAIVDAYDNWHDNGFHVDTGLTMIYGNYVKANSTLANEAGG